MGLRKTETHRRRETNDSGEKKNKTTRLDVERLSVRGYQCNGCAAKLSCELLIYRAWRTATAFHPLCRHGRRWKGGLVSFFLIFILSPLQYVLSNPLKSYYHFQSAYERTVKPMSRKANNSRNWNHYVRGLHRCFYVAICVHACMHLTHSFGWFGQLHLPSLVMWLTVLSNGCRPLCNTGSIGEKGKKPQTGTKACFQEPASTHTNTSTERHVHTQTLSICVYLYSLLLHTALSLSQKAEATVSNHMTTRVSSPFCLAA